MVATHISILQHNLEMERKHLLEQMKTEVDSDGEVSVERVAFMEQALCKIESGTYGRCDSCGQPIEPERLKALPEANLCYRCKTRQANREMIQPARASQTSY